MFEANILTFNPQDVLGIQAKLKQESIEFVKEATTGPTNAMLIDPGGNQLMLEQM